VEKSQLERKLGRRNCDSEESNEKCLKGNGFAVIYLFRAIQFVDRI